MARSVEIKKNSLILKDNKVEGFLERRVTPFGTSAKVDVPKRFISRRAYVVIVKR